MTCADVLDLLPDDSPETAGHLRACGSCRAAQDLYDQDGRDLAEAFRAAARRPATPHRRWLPLAAAAALVVSLLALAFVPPAPPAGPAAPDRLEFLVSRENALWGQVLAVDASGDVAVSVGLRDGVVPRQALSIYRRTSDGEVEVGTLVVDRVDPAASAGHLSERRLDPAPGDFVLADRLLGPAEKRAVLDHLFSFRTVTPEDERAVLDALHRLSDHDLAVRAAGRRDLLAGAGPYRVILDRGGLPLDLQVRGREALEETDRIDGLVRGGGLERDVEFLSRLRDPRAAIRLRAILRGVLPVYDHEAWERLRRSLRWNPSLDRYEAAP